MPLDSKEEVIDSKEEVIEPEKADMPSYKKIAKIATVLLQNLKSVLEDFKSDPSYMMPDISENFTPASLELAIKYLEDTSPEKEAKVNSLIEEFKIGYLGDEEYQILMIEFLTGNKNMTELVDDFLEAIPEKKRALSLGSFLAHSRLKYGKDSLKIRSEWKFLIDSANNFMRDRPVVIDISSSISYAPLNKIKETLSYGEVRSNFRDSSFISWNLKYAREDFTEALEDYVDTRQQEIYDVASTLASEDIETLERVEDWDIELDDAKFFREESDSLLRMARKSSLLKDTITYLKDNSDEKQEAIDKAIENFIKNKKPTPILTTAFLQGNPSMSRILEDYLLTFDEGYERALASAAFDMRMADQGMKANNYLFRGLVDRGYRLRFDDYDGQDTY